MAITSVTLNVNGMSCNHCVNAIESVLRELNGVQTATVDLKANTVIVTYNDAAVTLKTLKEGIEEAGYEVA